MAATRPAQRTERREAPSVSRGRRSVWLALPWLLFQIVAALAAQQLRRPLRRPSGSDLLLWPAAALVTLAFLIPLSQISGPLTGLSALAFIALAWHNFHAR